MSKGRQYQSSLRSEQARQTRMRIRRAARELFAEKGFASTTVTSIAEAAGVSPATVYSVFESKAGIVSAILDEMEETVDMDVRVAQMTTSEDPSQQLELWVAAHCALFTANSDVLRSAVEAIGNPEVAALYERGNKHRRAVLERLVEEWDEQEALREDLTATQAAEQMWLLSTVDSFLTAIDDLGWSPDHYQGWLLGLLTREILDL